jgi:DegV family protein with EDD domain
MGKVKVVTDSTADIAQAQARELGIIVIPHHIQLATESLLDGVNITADEYATRLGKTPAPMATFPPSLEEFRELYTRLNQTTDSIISIHLSAKLSDTYKNADAAKELLRDRCRIVVVDTQLASLGVGFIALAAAQAANEGASLDEVARQVRGMLPQTHILFFVENADFLLKGGRLGKASATLGPVANIKPLLRLESGEIFPLEKVRTRAKALERLYEFVADFPKIERMAILYSTTPNEAENLAKRIDAVFPKDKIVLARYGPTLGVHLGLGAMAVVVYEGEE